MSAIHFTLIGAGDIGYPEIMGSRRIHNTCLMMRMNLLSYTASQINPTLREKIEDAAAIIIELSDKVKTDDIKNEVQVLAGDLKEIATLVETRLNTPEGQVEWLAGSNLTDEGLRHSIAQLRIKAAFMEEAAEI